MIMRNGLSRSPSVTLSMFFRVTAAMKTDGRLRASELQMPIMLMRRAALSIGPRIVT